MSGGSIFVLSLGKVDNRYPRSIHWVTEEDGRRRIGIISSSFRSGGCGVGIGMRDRRGRQKLGIWFVVWPDCGWSFGLYMVRAA